MAEAKSRPAVTRLSDEATMELRELVRLRERWVQELGDHVRQLHRLVDLGSRGSETERGVARQLTHPGL